MKPVNKHLIRLKALCKIVTLKFPTDSKPFIVDTNASDVKIGAVLNHLNEVKCRTISWILQPFTYKVRTKV